MTGNILKTDIVIVGGGPAGLCAAISAASLGAKVILIDRNTLGGQLVKQTHMFFGSKKQYASLRGIDIADILIKELKSFENVKIMMNTTVLGIYEDGMITVEQEKKYLKIMPEKIIVATGASEKFLSFPNNDLPGIYGAGAVQTLLNMHGVIPGKDVLMIGAGNIGLIVSYQLMQAGVNVKAIIDASPKIGGYLVHAQKLRRMGIPIYLGHTVKAAHGEEYLESATIWQLDNKWQPLHGTEKEIKADVMCISVGLTPLCELLWQVGCEMKYIKELGGHVPVRDSNLKTSLSNVYVAGDVAGVEEASSAMVEGRLAGLSAAFALGYNNDKSKKLREDFINQLNDLRSGPVGEKIRSSLEKITV